MYRTQRQSEIMRLVRLRGACSIGELADRLSVSDETIRRTVKPLVSEGVLAKVHGGIRLPDSHSEPPFQKRMLDNANAKQRIAERVAAMISNGDTLMLDCGSTTAFVARALSQHSGLTVVTNSAEIARTLAPNNSNRVFMAGGELRSDDTAALGPEALAFASQFRVRHAILSIGAMGLDGSLMVYHLAEAEFSRAVINQAEQVIVAADASKFGRPSLVRICGPERIDTLVTDREPPGELAATLRDAGAKIELAA
ncbi:DeoR/GlpR family DNA-binding transcription regulator [Microbaculum marinum]|uniref:DeoR/GlpR family DNA-binding transcription regulator n=1 Tax=Microbaculum marinum TaxID=1764581 RepID=A0AAW9RNX6_9HYPH